MRRRAGVWLIAGVLFLLASLGLVSYNLHASLQAQESAQHVMEQMVARGAQPVPAQTETQETPQMQTEMIDGRAYVGAIEIPALKLSLPVLADWSYDLLKIAPCRYAGSCYENNLVLCAHNYRSHFNALRWIDMGEDVYFTTVNGEVFHYITVNRETLQPGEVARMRETDGCWDLTLFTCYIGGYSRCTVRCERAD